MNRTFYVPRRFHPAYSLLGRWLQRRLGDARRAEAVYLILLTGLLLALLLGNYLAWAVLEPAVTAAPTGPTAVAFWAAQIAGLGLCMLLGFVGYRPRVAVTVQDHALHLEQGARSLVLPFHTVTAVRTVSAGCFHRHYARYAATQVFVSRLPDEVLLFETGEAPVIVGLPPEDRATLLHLLENHLAPVLDVQTARVA